MTAMPLRCAVCGYSFEEDEWVMESTCPRCGAIAVRSVAIMGMEV